jgi:hypothetical protein
MNEQLARTAVADLPTQLGSEPQVNSWRVTLSYWGKVSVLMLPQKGTISRRCTPRPQTIRPAGGAGFLLQESSGAGVAAAKPAYGDRCRLTRDRV